MAVIRASLGARGVDDVNFVTFRRRDQHWRAALSAVAVSVMRGTQLFHTSIRYFQNLSVKLGYYHVLYSKTRRCKMSVLQKVTRLLYRHRHPVCLLC